MNEFDIDNATLVRGKLNSETARLPWAELQRYFAGGYTLLVDQQLDLIEVAFQFQQDNSQQVEQWLGQELVRQVKNDEARRWYNDAAELWACVVKPWVLVQETDPEQ